MKLAELEPRKYEDINDKAPLPDFRNDERIRKNFLRASTLRCGGPKPPNPPPLNLVYSHNAVTQESVRELVPLLVSNPYVAARTSATTNEMKKHQLMINSTKDKDEEEDEDGGVVNKDKGEPEEEEEELEAIMGSDGTIHFDEDWGLFSAILCCYNNHWTLKTGPEDWWLLVCHKIASTLDEYGDDPLVRNFFVDHQGKKDIIVDVGLSFTHLDPNRVFNQISFQIAKMIQKPDYVNLMKSDFMTTTKEQCVISQIMLMASTQKWFNFGMETCCGIPAVEMKGQEKDWVQLVDKFVKLRTLLSPITNILKLDVWFKKAQKTLENLLKTYQGEDMVEWWSHILSWTHKYGSGGGTWFDGWIIEIMDCNTKPNKCYDFPSGLVTVPFTLKENVMLNIQEEGLLVGGILGFQVEKDDDASQKVPVVEAQHIWNLCLPKHSKIAPFLTTATIPMDVDL